MRIVDSVFEISEEFLSKKNCPVQVSKNLDIISNRMTQEGVKKFPIKKLGQDNIYKLVLQEFVGCAINYCYWYGNFDIRPLDCSSKKMYEQVEKSFLMYQAGDNFEVCIQKLIENLAIERFPLLEERIKHLKELIPDAEDFCVEISNAIFENKEENINIFLEDMIRTFPGYASDMFLKRASLFFIQIYRQYGYFKNAMHQIHIPADYQVPKLLSHFGIILYDDYLEIFIKSGMLIPKGSMEECAIRAATIIASKKLQERTGFNISDIDAYFWLKRKEVTSPFHLTITTDY